MRSTALTMMGQRKPDEDARRRAMVRLNGMMFYSVAFASFLESTAPLDTARLMRLAQGHSELRQWLEQVWLPGRAERGRLLREYVETTWQEFDWQSAYEEFCESYRLRTAAHLESHGHALELFARCVTETTLAIFYRTLAKGADEPGLRALAAAAARDHLGYFTYFRGAFERLNGGKRAGFTATWRAAVASCRASREVDVAAAFQPLGRHWHGGWVFPELTYPEFLGRLAQLLKRHTTLGPMERLMFRPWLNPPRTMEVPRRLGTASGPRNAIDTTAAVRRAA